MARILAIADEVDRRLNIRHLRDLEPDIVVSCGDLPWDHLEFVVSVVNKPLVWVPGNHDPIPRRRDRAPAGVAGAGGPVVILPDFEEQWRPPPGPMGCSPLDDQIVDVKGVRFAGLGGSIRYTEGHHQYTDAEMARRVRKLAGKTRRKRLRDRKGVDVFVTHSPPRGLGDQTDPPHRGFTSFHTALERLQPRLMLHGHIHPFGIDRPDREIGRTRIVNVVPYKILEIDS